MLKLLTKLKANTSGATAIEYGLIAALVAVALIGTLVALGGNLDDIFSDIDTAVSTGTDPNAGGT